MSLSIPAFEPKIYEQRRERLAAAMRSHPVTQAAGGKALLLLFSPPEVIRNNDVEYAYRTDSDIAYLCGFEEPGCVVALHADDSGYEWTLFVRPRDKEMEIWNGFRNGVDGAVSSYGADEAFTIGELNQKLPSLMTGTQALWMHFNAGVEAEKTVLDALQQAKRRARDTGVVPHVRGDLAELIHPMRALKQVEEIAVMREAVRISMAGHAAAMRAVQGILSQGGTEAALAAELDYAFKRGGAARHGYEPIVASGANACVLHYNENCAPIEDGDLVLIDAGAEYRFYTGDITRTFPANGRFSGPQRDLYEISLQAQKESIQSVRIGSSMKEVDAVARRVLAQGLVDLGLLEGSLDELVEKTPVEGKPAWHPGRAPLDRFYPHRTGHYLGMDVHDVGPYHDGQNPVPFEEGVVVTVEPGLYVQLDDEEAPEAFRGIGIRIEDDVLVTDDAPEVLSAALPTDVDAVEAMVREAGS